VPIKQSPGCVSAWLADTSLAPNRCRPFLPHQRVTPEIVAAHDLAESINPDLAELGRGRLKELGDGLRAILGAPAATTQVTSLKRSLNARSPRPHPRLQQSAIAEAV
jgi:hypothetical protein